LAKCGIFFAQPALKRPWCQASTIVSKSANSGRDMFREATFTLLLKLCGAFRPCNNLKYSGIKLSQIKMTLLLQLSLFYNNEERNKTTVKVLLL